MVGQRKHTVFSNDETAAPGGLGWWWTERARKRDHARVNAELVNNLKWQWRSACAATSLAQMIYTPSGPTRAVPMIAHVDLGPPISFTVKVRPGQRLADFVAAAPAIAPALSATALDMALITPDWVRVVLRQAPLVALSSRSFGDESEALRFGA